MTPPSLPTADHLPPAAGASATRAGELTAAQATLLAQTIRSVTGVAELSSGRFGEVALLFPGQRVSGIRRLQLGDDSAIEVHIIARYGHDLEQLAGDIRAAVRAEAPAINRVDIVVADIAPQPVSAGSSSSHAPASTG